MAVSRRRPVAAAAALALVAAGASAGPAAAAFPGANGRISFDEARPAPDGPGFLGDVHVIAPDGTGHSIVQRGPGHEGDAAWAPDGRRLAFGREIRPGSEDREPVTGIAVVEPGGVARTVIGLGALTIAPSWTPDGRILFASDHESRRSFRPRRNGPPAPLWIYSAAADGTDVRRLLRTQGGVGGMECTDPVASPDGTRIALFCIRFGPRRPSNGAIYLMPAGGGVLTRITPAATPEELNPAWSPDSTRIAFERVRLFAPGPSSARSDMATMDATGGDVRVIARTPWFETNPVYSPDGTKIAFTSDRDTKPARRRGRPAERLNAGFELYTANVDGTGVTRLTRNRRPDAFPDWGPAPVAR